MTLISWVLMLPVLPRPKSYRALLRERLACTSLYCIRDRILVRLVVRIWSGCALCTGLDRAGPHLGQHSPRTGGRAPFSDWSIWRGHLSVVPQPGGAFFLLHTKTPNVLAGPYGVCPASSPKARKSQMFTGEVPSEL